MNPNDAHDSRTISRRRFLAGSAAVAMGFTAASARNSSNTIDDKALIAITLDLEMSRHYPKRGMREWDYQKGNLDERTKQYSVDAARVVKKRGGLIHFFCVGRVLEQASIDWLKELNASGHLIGNHTYDHVNVTATEPDKTQFRFQRAPWLVRGKTAQEVIRDNIETTSIALRQRANIEPNGFRTPGGFAAGLTHHPNIQQMLLDLGFDWVSSKYPAHQRGQPQKPPSLDVYRSIVAAQRESQPFVYPSGLIEVPMSPISDVTAFRSTFWKLPYFLKAIRMSVEWAIESRSVFDFLAHPSCLLVEDPHFESIKLICDLVAARRQRAAIVGLDTIARRAANRHAQQ